MSKNPCSEFAPNIWGLELRNYKLLEDSLGNKHIKGDIYRDGKCVGAYDPVHQVQEGSQGELFIKLVDEDMRAEYSNYRTIYEYPGNKGYDEPEFKGLNILLCDLERLIIMYEMMKGDYVLTVGIANGDSVKVLPFMKDPGTRDKEELLDFIQDHSDLMFDPGYPTLVFLSEEDFVFNKPIVVM